jgi:hypothetical protein
MWRVRDQEAASVDHLIADLESSRQGVIRRTWELGSRNRHSHRAIPTKIHRPHRNTTHGHLRRARTQAAAGSPATPLRHGNGGKCFILAPPGTPDGPGQVVFVSNGQLIKPCANSGGAGGWKYLLQACMPISSFQAGRVARIIQARRCSLHKQ